MGETAPLSPLSGVSRIGLFPSFFMFVLKSEPLPFYTYSPYIVNEIGIPL